MNIKSLNLKNKLKDEITNEEYYDLTAPSFTYISEYGIRSLHYVAKDQEGRIDLVSDQYFGTGEFIDAICIVNNIFNPFSVKEGDILIIPNLKTPENFYKKPKKVDGVSSIKSEFIEKNQNQKDKNRIERLIEKAKTKENGVKNPLPPNILQPDQEIKEFKSGKIKLATNLNTKDESRG